MATGKVNPGGLRVLLLEDSETDAELIRDVLQETIPDLAFRQVDNREDFLRELESFSPQIILSDYLVPGFGGRMALEHVRTSRPGLPFLFVSGALGEELAVELVRAGATDYILKDRMSRLPSAVLRSLEEARERALLAERTAEVQEKTRQLAQEVDVRRKAQENLLKSQKDLRRLALELSRSNARELRRIAVEIHDRIGQNLVLVLMELERMKNKRQNPETLEQAMALLDRTIHQARSLALELSPPVLYEFGFFAALEWLSERLRSAQAVSIVLKFGNQRPRPSIEVQVFLYNAVRELIHNALHNGSAREVIISSVIDPEGFFTELTSDGAGFEPATLEKMEATGLGLFSIRERLSHLGGSLSVEPAGSPMSRVKIFLPADAHI